MVRFFLAKYSSARFSTSGVVMIRNNLSSNGNGTFSADVKLHLHVGGERFELGHLGPDFALLGEACPISSNEGEIETIVDNKVSRWPIRITTPLDGSTKRFEFEGVG